MLGARPFDRSLMIPINATDMQHLSPQHKSYVPSTGVQLRIPSSFAVKNPYAKHPYEVQNKPNTINDNKISNAEEYNCSLINVSANNNIAKSQLTGGKLINEHSQHASNTMSNERAVDSKIINSSLPAHLAEQEIVPAREMHTSGNYISYGGNALKSTLEGYRETLNNITPCSAHLETINSEAVSMAESMLADALLPPSAIHASDIIGSTLDEKSLMFIREKLADKYNAIENSAMHAVPKSSRLLDTSDVLHSGGSKENNNNPANINKDVERTAIITATKNPTGTLLEKTEVNNIVNTPLEAERKIYKPSSQIIESIALPLKTNHKPAKNNSSVIEESKTIRENTMDPLLNEYTSVNPTLPILNSTLQINSQCPVSASPLQAELNSSSLQPTVIYSEQLQKQIFPHIVGDFNEQSNTQHIDHLKNNVEDLKIDSTKVHKCEKCHEDIRVGDVIVTAEKANNASWHPGCFVCSVCNELLVDLVYFYYKNKLYCGRDLAAFLGIVRCFACDEVSVCNTQCSLINAYFLITNFLKTFVST